jgi:large subunit ribosomal protein L3
MNGILAKKLGMTQLFLENGQRVAVTVLQGGANQVIVKKTVSTDGYDAVCIGFEDIKESKLSKAELGLFQKAGLAPKRHLVEFKAEDINAVEVGQVFDVSLFEGVESVHVTGTSKGRGFAGTIKRYNFASGPRSHGTGNRREPGSLGATSGTARVFPGKKLPGHYGDEKVTVKNLKVVKVDTERNLIFVKGAVPGPKDGLIKVRKA